MELITRFELASRTTQELHALYREVFNALMRSASGSNERRICLVTLENVIAELSGRRCTQKPQKNF